MKVATRIQPVGALTVAAPFKSMAGLFCLCDLKGLDAVLGARTIRSFIGLAGLAYIHPPISWNKSFPMKFSVQAASSCIIVLEFRIKRRSTISSPVSACGAKLLAPQKLAEAEAPVIFSLCSKLSNWAKIRLKEQYGNAHVYI